MRLGDDIDDFCSRCKRTTDHAIVAMMGDQVQKVRCRTCNSDHDYRHNQNPKKELTAKDAFEKVLGSVKSNMPGASQPAKKSKRG